MRIAAVLLLVAGCGDNIIDPFEGSVSVSSTSPFHNACSDTTTGVVETGLEVEPWLAVDPTDDQHLVGAWQQDRWSSGGANGLVAAASSDGGKTWTTSTTAFSLCEGGSFGRATDPWVAITIDGTVYQAGLAFDPGGTRSAVLASRSTDGGLTWEAPIAVGSDDDGDVFNDKDSITADPTMPQTVYLTWDRLTGTSQPQAPTGRGPAMFARAVGGVWEVARPIFDPGDDAQTIGNEIVVLPDGTLVDGFDLITGTSTTDPSTRANVIRSTDHGDTWSAAIDVGVMQPKEVVDDKHDVDVRSGDILPQLAVDAKTGRLYVAFEDSSQTKDENVVVSSSSDGGLTWSAPVHVAADDGDAFGPTLAVLADGTVGVLYYDTRDDDPTNVSNFLVSAWLSISTDGGATWTETRLSKPFDMTPAQLDGGYFLGDYQGLGVTSHGFLPFFAGVVGQPQNPGDIFAQLPPGPD